MMPRREIAELERLLGIVRYLREQCPWDRDQRLQDVSKSLIEEAYEAAEAISQGDRRAIADELGDLLVQVLFAAIVAEQNEGVQVHELIERAADKLIRRHAHVYAGAKTESAADVVTRWNQIKSEERKAAGFVSVVDGVARGLPALMRAQKLGARAREAGLDWTDIHDVLAKVREEMDEVEGSLAAGDRNAAANELGDMMLALANAPRFIGYDAEETLHGACDKFIRRFKEVERLISERALNVNELTPTQWDSLWREVKQLGKGIDAGHPPKA
jgi:MazG family protein